MRQSTVVRINFTLVNILVLLFFLFPFLWMLSASFKMQVQVLSSQHLFMFTPTVKNYITVFKEYDYLKYIINSFSVATVSTAGSLLLGLPAAYAIARYRMQYFAVTILIAKIIPGITYLVPWYILFNKLHLVDTYTGLVLSHMVIGLPFIMWVMLPFFETFPKEVEESSWIDGNSKIRTFFQMVLPVSMPGIVTSSLLAFIFSWNNFMFSLILAGEKTKPLPIAVFNFISGNAINWGALMAAACIITLPVVVIALFAQKYIVSGLSAGAVKG
ncbi:multiple sugar transport system permease protein [Paenibacillus sp. V4I3]|uniref:carbohydrate ABC transporter permease n=1 Tax=unclassified Paenibacillus TaxID=185978 RepID=UPI00278882D2|nr:MULTISPECIES: carbohydrate ABC transporter permease [unclassified Paenibacillus]MDQ0874466.1 multiple sugar transport system permease protein [Paenibacillus sp. V4I3]MDQ0889776.1 multiple sugar transport system permease protein [Paenibacillus sp. V4I9]